MAPRYWIGEWALTISYERGRSVCFPYSMNDCSLQIFLPSTSLVSAQAGAPPLKPNAAFPRETWVRKGCRFHWPGMIYIYGLRSRSDLPIAVRFGSGQIEPGLEALSSLLGGWAQVFRCPLFFGWLNRGGGLLQERLRPNPSLPIYTEIDMIEFFPFTSEVA